ncbi:MAG: PH domain-containing protein [Fusobacterium sp.]|nr:PH domain-containing protein [Fusobacterium sp.]
MSLPENLKEIVFVEQINTVPEVIERMLVHGEEIVAIFKSLRDYGAITNKRIIYCDKQGLIGKKVEAYSIPLKSIDMFSSENSGMIDITTEIQLWTKMGNIKMSLPKKVDVHSIIRAFSQYIL